MTDEKKGEAELSPARKRAAAARRAAIEAAARQADIDAGVGIDRRKKSRNKRIAERAVETAKVSPPTDHSLETMDNAPLVSDMARAGIGLTFGSEEDDDGDSGLLSFGGEDDRDDLEFADPFGVTGGDRDDEEGGEWL